MYRNLSPLHRVVAVLLLAATPLVAQDYRTEVNSNLGIAFKVFHKLAPVPMRIGSEGGNQVQKFQPEGDGDYIYGRYGTYVWDLEVFDFGDASEIALRGNPNDDKGDGGPETGEGGEGRADAERNARKEILDKYRAHSMRDFVTDKDRSKRPSRKVVVEGKVRKGSKKRPESEWWEYYDVDKRQTYDGRGFEMCWYKIACAYNLPDRQVALVLTLPVDDGLKPDRKYITIAKRMLQSVQIIEVDEDEGVDEDRDKFADTPKRKQELDRLKANIGDLDNWDYFTTPKYIICFSWQKKADRRAMYKFARETSVQLENIREMFEEYYPPHEKMDAHYSVIRVCSNYDEFLRYGQIPPGVIGWFSPGTKELCLFYDRLNQFPGIDEVAVAYHEAWHEYSDQYWPDVELHRWFDEGLAEYFGAHRKVGKRWKFVYHKGRYTSIKDQIRSETYIPSREIVSWHKDKFYGPRAPDHYAQGWAMVDFLIRGPKKLRSRFPDELKKVMETYSQICLEKKSEKKAVEAAFEGVDMDAFDEVWHDWVQSGKIKR